MQRFFDILFSLSALLALSPALIIVMIVLRFTGEYEVFYLQERIGRYGSVFRVLKFATMLKDSPNFGAGTVTVQDDPRVLPVGRFLRMTKINELPQLINVFLGDMSLIGPRPVTPDTFQKYSPEVKKRIIKLRPGLSGIGSIVFRDEERLLTSAIDVSKFYDNEIAPYKGKLEVWFSENNSIYTYFLLIFATIWIVIRPNSKWIWKAFRNLPKPEGALRRLL
jgi:lipopolysaccharide/colanic/teichoic acid biosynthesis glycosyltransferase